MDGGFPSGCHVHRRDLQCPVNLDSRRRLDVSICASSGHVWTAPVVKGCFEAVVNVSSAVIRRPCGERRAGGRSSPARTSRGTPGRTEKCLQVSSELVDRIELNVSSLWRRQGPLSTMTG